MTRGDARPSKWEHTSLAVTDLDTAVRFYREAFSFEVLLEEHLTDQIRGVVGLPQLECDLAQLHSPASGHVLELIAFRNVPSNREDHGPTRPGAGHLAFIVPELATAISTIQALGATVIGGVTAFDGGAAVYCRDPAGTFFELAEGQLNDS